MDIEINVGKEENEKEDMEDMAEKGRNGDEVMGHLTPGEVVLPVPLVEKLGPAIRKAFEAMDLDMDQYTVGHEKNSINEETDCPEFGVGMYTTMRPSYGRKLEQQAAARNAPSQEELDAKAETERLAQEMEALQAKMAEEQSAAAAQMAETAKQTQAIQRESGERRLSRLRARLRSTSRPLLSKGVSL